jgi:hypothetical protein
VDEALFGCGQADVWKGKGMLLVVVVVVDGCGFCMYLPTYLPPLLGAVMVAVNDDNDLLFIN